VTASPRGRPGCYRDGHNGLEGFPAPGFESGTDGPSLILVGVDGSRTSLRAAAYAAPTLLDDFELAIWS
jgi:hypothetical protein